MQLYEEHPVCIRCGRKLKTEESRELGFGPTCYKKWQTESISKNLFDVELSNNKNSEEDK